MRRGIRIFTLFFLLLAGIGMTALAKGNKEGQKRLDRQTQVFVKRAALLVTKKGRVARRLCL